MSTVIYHIHHIIPRHAGGTNNPSNLVKLTIEEHAEAHRLLWEKHGRLEDKIAWLGLSGLTQEAANIGQELATKAKKDPSVRRKMSLAKKEHWNAPEYQEKMQRIRSSTEYKEKCRHSALGRGAQYKQQISATIKKLWQDPEFQKKQKEGFTPHICEMLRCKSNNRWSDPEYRAKMIEAQRKRRLREKSITE